MNSVLFLSNSIRVDPFVRSIESKHEFDAQCQYAYLPCLSEKSRQSLVESKKESELLVRINYANV